jgi:hypothetical protein
MCITLHVGYPWLVPIKDWRKPSRIFYGPTLKGAKASIESVGTCVVLPETDEEWGLLAHILGHGVFGLKELYMN